MLSLDLGKDCRSRGEQVAQKQAQAEQRAREQQALSEHISDVLQAVRLEQVSH